MSSDSSILVSCADGEKRKARITGEADTFFSVPAVVRVSGKRIKGFVAAESQGPPQFHAERFGSNLQEVEELRTPMDQYDHVAQPFEGERRVKAGTIRMGSLVAYSIANERSWGRVIGEIPWGPIARLVHGGMFYVLAVGATQAFGMTRWVRGFDLCERKSQAFLAWLLDDENFRNYSIEEIHCLVVRGNLSSSFDGEAIAKIPEVIARRRERLAESEAHGSVG